MSSEPFEARPQTTTHHEEHSPALAVLLIAIGVIWLLSNLGVIAHISLGTLVRLWPLVLVYLGVKQILDYRRSGA